MRRKDDNLSLGGEWPRIPSDAEYSPPGSGWRAVLLIVAISFVILGLAGYMAMILHHAGGGR